MYNYYRTYYTLDDIRKTLGGSYVETAGPYSLSLKTFNEFLNDCLWKAGFSTCQGVSESNESTICFHDYIWPRFYQEAIIYTDSDEDEDFVKKFARIKIGQIFSWWQSSSEKYVISYHTCAEEERDFSQSGGKTRKKRENSG